MAVGNEFLSVVPVSTHCDRFGAGTLLFNRSYFLFLTNKVEVTQ